MFDVIEHIDDQDSFMESVLYHLKPGGILAINVTALQSLFSQYDIAAGHIRRYRIHEFDSIETKHNLESILKTYWGFSFLPLLIIRKWLLKISETNKRTIYSGFSPRSKLANKLLFWLSQLEVIPQTIIGTSLMILYRKPE